MSETGVIKKGITRRSFLKTTAALGGVAALSGTAFGCSSINTGGAGATVKDDVYSGVCIGNCNGGCRLNIAVREGKVVETSMAEFPDPDYNRICLKGLSHVQRIYGPERIKYPMRRIGERGGGQWERISWEEAINEICTKWKSYIDQFGATSLFFQIGGTTRTGAYAYHSFGSLLEASTLTACDDYAGLFVGPLLVGTTPMNMTGEIKSIRYAKTIFVWGANPTDSHIVNTRFYLDAVDNGAKVIVIDPVFTTIASKADAYSPIKVGTDAVLAMAMTRHIIDKGLADVEFLKTNTVAPFLVKESDGTYLRLSDLGRPPIPGAPNATTGESTTVDAPVVRAENGDMGLPTEIKSPVIHGTFDVNGIKVTASYDLLINAVTDYSPDKAESICGVPAAKIVEYAELFVKGAPTTVYVNMGYDHYYNGHTAFTSIAALLMVAGQFGKPGTGWTGGYCEGWNVNWAGLTAPQGKTQKFRIPTVCFPDLVKDKKFLTTEVNPKALFMCGKNILGNATGRQDWIEAFKGLDLVVCPNYEMSDTAAFSDIILPITHIFETEDFLAVGHPHTFNVFQDKAIDPLYESKSDFEIAKLILQGMGQKFDYTSEEFLQLAIDTPLAKGAGITYDTLKEKKIIDSVPASMRSKEGLLILGDKGSWRTPTGRAQFYFETVVPRANTGISFDKNAERLPHWEPPIEAGEDNPLAAKYPFVCIQPHTKWRAHTTFSYVQWLRELDPEPVVYLNPDDAAEKSIKEGDIVRVYNDRGYVVIKVRYNAGLQSGIIFIPKGWQYGSYIDGHYQDITTRKFHPYCVNHIFFDARVQIEKV
ncbi:dehydrogenase [Actinomycetota bacterium]|nr:dehydrogenase [Actinomycetota bacterium]